MGAYTPYLTPQLEIHGGEGASIPHVEPIKEAKPLEAREAILKPVQKKIVKHTPKPESVPQSVPSGSVWDRLAMCESGGDWSINTGNGFYGGLQFTLSSWQAVGGSGYPHQQSREEQILRGQKLQQAQGWGAWPSCASQLGLL